MLLIAILFILYLSRDGEEKSYSTLYDFLYNGLINKTAMFRIFDWQDAVLQKSVVLHHILFVVWILLGGLVLICSVGAFFWMNNKNNDRSFYYKFKTFLVGVEMVFVIIGTRYTVIYYFVAVVFLLWAFISDTARKA
ncbi:MAG: hypothetical protein K5865_07470 [Eubacterium sp.]|nr:hypothetical protein [Eubacterium sp.]